MTKQSKMSAESPSAPKPQSLKDLMLEIDTIIAAGETWCSVDKAVTLVSIVLAQRPKVVVELGVWVGGSAIPMAIALRHLGAGQLVAIDAWSAQASVLGQGEVDAKWWGEKMGEEGHERAFGMFTARMKEHGITSEHCVVQRQRTDEASVPSSIDLLHHDANHGPQAVADVKRWAPAIRVGGFLVIDDLDWPGGHVMRAHDHALDLGFVDLYPLDRGCVMQRVRVA